jgi:glutamyl-tRNA reductase
MIQALKLFHSSSPQACAAQNHGEVFSLQTCQRSLYLGFDESVLRQKFNICEKSELYSGEDAYLFLLETICGLKSQVLAENEIVSQFKRAYGDYLKSGQRNSHLMNILEKLLGDGKKIRTQYLMQIGQQTYAGITRKILTQTSDNREVLILGSGQLAEDVIKLLKKRYSIQIAARNSERVIEICRLHQTTTHPWCSEPNSYAHFPLIINTIGADETYFEDSFFANWSNLNPEDRLFIDLGSPSMLKTTYQPENGVIQLDHVFEHGRNLDKEKLEKVAKARTAIQELIEKRRKSFNSNLPHGWEELQFA